jgi:dihydrofolate reductase
MKAIVAMALNRAIGRDDKLPWHPIKEDFRWFKEFTTGKILVTGRKTFDALPPLKNRNLIVLTRYDIGYADTYNPKNNMAYCYRNKDDILNLDSHHKGELIVIGGAKTYELFLPHITEFYVTHIKDEYEADTFMPPFEHLFSKKEIIRAFNDKNMVMYPPLLKTEMDPESLKEFDGYHVTKYSK